MNKVLMTAEQFHRAYDGWVSRNWEKLQAEAAALEVVDAAGQQLPVEVVSDGDDWCLAIAEEDPPAAGRKSD